MAVFEKGHKKKGGNTKGTKHKKTIVKEAFGVENIEQLKDKCLRNWNKMLDSKNIQVQLIATKEVSKYLFPQKREINLGLQESELELLRQAAAEQMRKAL